MTTNKIVYIAHPLGDGPDRARNLERATDWVAWAARQGVAPVASWILLASRWDETPANRERGLEIDKQLIARCDEVWLVGGRVSPGMQIEADMAREVGITVVDLTHLGKFAPAERCPRCHRRDSRQREIPCALCNPIGLAAERRAYEAGYERAKADAARLVEEQRFHSDFSLGSTMGAEMMAAKIRCLTPPTPPPSPCTHTYAREADGRCPADAGRPLLDELARLRGLAEKVNAIRNNIIGAQTVHWSEHVYPLVAALDDAGIKGLPYPEARANVGTLLDRIAKLEAALRDLAARHILTCTDDRPTVTLREPPCGECARCRARALLTPPTSEEGER